MTMMMNMERRHCEKLQSLVIQKALKKFDGAPFKAFAAQRERWAIEQTMYIPGPHPVLRLTGKFGDAATKTLQLEQGK